MGIKTSQEALREYRQKQAQKKSDPLDQSVGAGKAPPCAVGLQNDYGTATGESGGVEFGEISTFLPVKWGETKENSPGGITQKPFFPEASILADYHQYAVTQTEGADVYISGSILPISGALLGRHVWVSWSAYNGKLYPNIYSILVGPPGNLKSTSIYPAEKIAHALLEPTRFLKHNYSPEALFDSFFRHPDRLLCCSDAGSTITKWANPYDGQRLSNNFLTLFDGEPLSENFRHNREKNKEDAQERTTTPTSLNILFGATLSKCQFSGNSERDGLQRRFLYHLALKKARKLDRPEPNQEWVERLTEQFRRLTFLKGAFIWDSAAQEYFDKYKAEVEARLEETDPYDESTRGRLATLCAYALKIAQIFECAVICRDKSWVPDRPSVLVLKKEILELAVAYVEECFKAAQSLADVANQKVIQEKGETLLESIRGDFSPLEAAPDSIIVTRSQLTRQYAHNPKRRSGYPVTDLYERFIPCLIRSGEAKLLVKKGKKEIYAFRVE